MPQASVPVPRARHQRSDSGFRIPGILEATPDRLSHPPLGSGQPELARVTSGPFPPRGRPPPKEKRSPLFLGHLPRVVGIVSGLLGPVGGARGRMTVLVAVLDPELVVDTPEEVTRVRAACSVPRTGEREGASEAEESCG